MTLSDEQIQDLLRVGNPTDEECRLIRMGWDAALARMRTTAAPSGWLRAIDEALVVTHLGVANASDTYEQAKAKLDSLEATEKDSAHHKALAESALRVAKGWEDKCDELRVKIESMEQQEPVAWYSKQYGFVYMSRHSSQFEHGSILYLRNGAPAWRIEGSSKVALLDMASLPHGTVFYALTGAKGE